MSFIKHVALALVIAAVATTSTSSSSAASSSSSFITAAEARECKVKKGSHVWKHGGGTFRRIKGTLTWEEANEKGEVQGTFQEFAREHEGIILRHEERGVNILLRNDMAAIQNKGQRNYQQLYGGSWLKTVDCTEPKNKEGGEKKKKKKSA